MLVPSIFVFVQIVQVFSAIRTNSVLNKLLNVNPVGGARRFMPVHSKVDPRVTFVPEDCTPTPNNEVVPGPVVRIDGDYYEDLPPMTVKTVIIPEHIDHLHFDVTTSDPYYTVGRIDADGFHPTPSNLDTCEEIYQEHIREDSEELTEESQSNERIPVTVFGETTQHVTQFNQETECFVVTTPTPPPTTPTPQYATEYDIEMQKVFKEMTAREKMDFKFRADPYVSMEDHSGSTGDSQRYLEDDFRKKK